MAQSYEMTQTPDLRWKRATSFFMSDWNSFRSMRLSLVGRGGGA